MKMREKELQAYFDLMARRPDLFEDNALIPMEKDVEVMRQFSKQTGMKIGVLYQSQYNMLVTDLIVPKSKEPYVYERIIPQERGGVVVVTKYKGKFLLLKQFRHSIRNFQYCFVRGYGEAGISTRENVAKEVAEEIGAHVESCVFLGEFTADSGLSSGVTSVYLCDIQGKIKEGETEGIKETVLVDEAEFVQWIGKGKISDGFTLAAYTFYCAYTQEQAHPERVR